MNFWIIEEQEGKKSVNFRFSRVHNRHQSKNYYLLYKNDKKCFLKRLYGIITVIVNEFSPVKMTGKERIASFTKTSKCDYTKYC